MQRRGSVRFGASLAAIVAALMVVVLGTAVSAAATTVAVETAPATAPATPSATPATTPATTPADDTSDAPSVTVSDFYPESSNLSDCVGLVEKPGCGSESRGGWRQTAVFVLLFIGLGAILWRVSRGIKANRATVDGDAERTADHT